MSKELICFRINGDERGSLVAIEALRDIPFNIKRVYYIYGTQGNVTRGLHAHRQLKQVLISISGSCRIMLDDGMEKKYYLLDNPALGLFIDKMIWREMYDFSPTSVLLVLASDFFSEDDYIKSYNDFRQLLNEDSTLNRSPLA